MHLAAILLFALPQEPGPVTGWTFYYEERPQRIDVRIAVLGHAIELRQEVRFIVAHVVAVIDGKPLRLTGPPGEVLRELRRRGIRPPMWPGGGQRHFFAPDPLPPGYVHRHERWAGGES